MNSVETLVSLWRQHGTKALGTAQMIVAGLIAIDGFDTKWWMVANVVLGAMTINRGFTNSKAAE